jgi:hypothetical protein
LTDDHHLDADDRLVDELRVLVGRVDPVPPLVIEAAKAALGWRRLDAELAELLSDSSLEDDAMALARGAGAPVRYVIFSAGTLTIDLEVHVEGEQRTVLGQLSPATAGRVEVERADETEPVAVEADRLGRFRVTLPTGGSIRLALSDRTPPIQTSWITV